MHLLKKPFVLAFLFLALAAQGAGGQAVPPAGRSWYLGVQGGTSFGQSTFSSITEHGVHWGLQGGLSAGYRFNRLLSLEAGVQYGGQRQSSLDCTPLWLSEAGVSYAAPVLGETGWYYKDLYNRTQWGKLFLQANFDLLALVTRPESRWSLELSPQLSAVTTRTRLVTPDREIPYARQWHLGYGGQASLGYRISERLGAALYGGITSLTGEHFDNLPPAHKANILWDAGVKLRVALGEAGKRAQAEADRAAAEEAARLAAEQAAAEKAAREAAEQAARDRAAREAAERAAREQAGRAAAAKAAAEKAQALATPIPTVYFANNSSAIPDGSAASLASALPILEKYPDFRLEIHAYASRSGSKAYNERLSEQRMEAVRQWFTAHGVAPERLGQAYFHGVDYEAATEEQARRADIRFVK